MNREEIQLVVLGTLAEIVAPIHPVRAIEIRPFDDARPFDPVIRMHLS